MKDDKQQAPRGSFIDTNEWVPVHTLPGFAACIEYFINRKGEIKSTKGNVERILKAAPNQSGYPQVSITQRIGRKPPLKVLVHKLVALAFLGNPPTPYGRGPGCTMVDHIDEDKTNCHAANLRWVTRSENNNKLPYPRFNGVAHPGEHSPEECASRKNEYNREFMRKRRSDPEFKEQEAESQRKRREARDSDPEKREQHLAIERERDAARRERRQADPEKAAKQREYKREWARKNRAKKKQENTLQ